MCGIENLRLWKARTSGVNACIMGICIQLKNAIHAHRSTGEIPKQEHSRESAFTRRLEHTKMFYNVCVVAVKFRDPTLRKRLLATGKAELKEWVKSREGYWSALTYSGQAGQNMLGQILMKVREFIRRHENPPTVKLMPDVTRVDHKTDGQSTPHWHTPGAQ